eukprot:GHVP01023304.1.p2 GENE.GHVP01023304.1~~GHVP01023304.1.p2  ORF type:complete len:150 (+),score=25.27 GHVP01023304.1:1257-1706(+)
MDEQGFEIRILSRDDYERGFLGCLRELTEVGDITIDDFKNTYDKIVQTNTHFIYVVIDRKIDKVIGTASLIIEQKFIRKCGKVGHLEDVCIQKEYNKKGIGKNIIKYCMEKAKEYGCYKIIGDCKNELLPFYEKCGLNEKDKQIVRYFH